MWDLEGVKLTVDTHHAEVGRGTKKRILIVCEYFRFLVRLRGE